MHSLNMSKPIDRQQHDMSAASVMASTASIQEAGPGSDPRATLQALRVEPVPIRIAKAILVNHHYLHSLPGGTCLAFGVFVGDRLKGALTLGVGPANAHKLVQGATTDDCLTLTRLWLSDELPSNSESRVIGTALRALRRHTSVKFILSYADPTQGHLGVIYQASNFIYTGVSAAMPLYDLGDGVARHSRSLGQIYGTHSIRYFKDSGVPVHVMPQTRKHRYIYLLDPGWRSRLRTPVLPYPKKENA